MEETVRPLVAAAWRGPNWSHSADDYAYYDADEKPGSSAVEALYALTPEDVAAVNEGRKKRALKALRRFDLCRCGNNEYCQHCYPVEFRSRGVWGGPNVQIQAAQTAAQEHENGTK